MIAIGKLHRKKDKHQWHEQGLENNRTDHSYTISSNTTRNKDLFHLCVLCFILICAVFSCLRHTTCCCDDRPTREQVLELEVLPKRYDILTFETSWDVPSRNIFLIILWCLRELFASRWNLKIYITRICNQKYFSKKKRAIMLVSRDIEIELNVQLLARYSCAFPTVFYFVCGRMDLVELVHSFHRFHLYQQVS